MKAIYADANATTPPHPSVIEAMAQSMAWSWGNPSSSHSSGKQARQSIDQARTAVLGLCGANRHQVVFTSGGTEANNLAVWSALSAHHGRHIVVSEIEHPSVLVPIRAAQSRGYRVTLVRSDSSGMIDLAHLADALSRHPGETALVSLMWANNETGVIQPVPEACALAQAAGALFHTDAVQAVAKTSMSLMQTPVDYLTLSAHKFGGPKGAGALIMSQTPNRYRQLAPLVLGGGQEKGARSGTENTHGIVGMGTAANLAASKLIQPSDLCVRDLFEAHMLALFPSLQLLGASSPRVPNTSLLRLPGYIGATIVRKLDQLGVAVSTGSACHSGSVTPSKTLTSMGLGVQAAQEVLRVSFLPEATHDDAEALVEAFSYVLAPSSSNGNRSKTPESWIQMAS